MHASEYQNLCTVSQACLKTQDPAEQVPAATEFDQKGLKTFAHLTSAGWFKFKRKSAKKQRKKLLEQQEQQRRSVLVQVHLRRKRLEQKLVKHMLAATERQEKAQEEMGHVPPRLLSSSPADFNSARKSGKRQQLRKPLEHSRNLATGACA